MGTKVEVMPKVRQVYYCAYADFPTTGVATGDLAYGTDTYRLYRWNGAAWQPITSDIASTKGTYTGNDTANRAIPHGLGKTPSLVLITSGNGTAHIYVTSLAMIYTVRSGNPTGASSQNAVDGTNFYVGEAISYVNSANNNLWNYYWVVLG